MLEVAFNAVDIDRTGAAALPLVEVNADDDADDDVSGL